LVDIQIFIAKTWASQIFAFYLVDFQNLSIPHSQFAKYVANIFVKLLATFGCQIIGLVNFRSQPSRPIVIWPAFMYVCLYVYMVRVRAYYEHLHLYCVIKILKIYRMLSLYFP
jgi:hypothetical protein